MLSEASSFVEMEGDGGRPLSGSEIAATGGIAGARQPRVYPKRKDCLRKGGGNQRMSHYHECKTDTCRGAH